MSGGVDSSVASALLKRAGFDLIGVFMRLNNLASAREAEAKAKKAAQKLGISFSVLDLRVQFKKTIIDYFLKEYKEGRTPNPCVLCNKEIKFKFLLKKMLETKADFIATGHYARIKRKGKGKKVKTPTKSLKLLRAEDKQKDQSYFLWRLGQKELKKTLFPIGDYTKSQVRQMAKKFGLPTAEAKESQEVCFIEACPKASGGSATFNFLKKQLGQKPGGIVSKKGEWLGHHNGLCFYTLGQRKRIGLSGGPYYVVAKNLKKNELVVSRTKKDLEQREVLLKGVNWLAGKPFEQTRSKDGLKVKAQIRYNSPLSRAIIKKAGNRYKVIFERPQFAPSPGQSAAWYQNEQLLGGGIIS